MTVMISHAHDRSQDIPDAAGMRDPADHSRGDRLKLDFVSELGRGDAMRTTWMIPAVCT